MYSKNKNTLILVSLIICLLLIGYFLLTQPKNPKVLMYTKYGSIEIVLYAKKAPITTANFLRYIKENRLEGATFYRTVTMQNQPHNKIKIQVIQGGLMDENDPKNLPPIKLETTVQTGIHHLDGTISMARDTPNSATSQFFICIGKQPELDYGGKRNPDGQGFAAFGRVIKGMNVVKKIQASPEKEQYIINPINILRIKILNK